MSYTRGTISIIAHNLKMSSLFFKNLRCP